MKSFFSLLMLGFIFYSCGGGCINREKMDSLLFEKIQSFEKENNLDDISFLFKVNTVLTESLEKEISDIGIGIETKAGNIITAKGNYKELSKLSTLNFIEKMELSVTRPLK